MSAEDELGFDELVAILRVRLRDADAIKDSDIHSFKVLMADLDEAIPHNWYWEALEHLEAQGHLDHPHKVSGGDAGARLSAVGRYYLRATESEPEGDGDEGD